ncbi:MAG TPA: alpha/beta hydrolase-fold protein [Candidatus Binatia bacterium]|jgi:enterochelin esterase family protein|nr:alpha/beta hydrolase-fold protein [Candidatus Binatia bacterium]
MVERQHDWAVASFPAWRQRLEQAAEPHLQDEMQNFLQVLRTVGTPLIDGLAVHFIYYDPRAYHVAVTGELTDWGRTGVIMPLTPLRHTGLFHTTLELDGPARLEYKLVVDGRVIVDPLCPHTVDNGMGERNSYFVVGDFREPPELSWVPTVPHGRVEEFDCESRLLRNRRRIHAYLPPGYDEERVRRFPTLYVHDGGEYLHRGRLPTVLDNLIFSREISPLIAIMVDPVVRGREYRASEDYATFLEAELLPHLEGRYRTLAQREARGVMGASLGGLISTYVALSRPHLFSRVGGQSSALHLEEARIAALLTSVSARTAFYLDVGKYEPRYLPAHGRIVARLTALGYPCFFQQLAGGHNWTSWRTHLKDLLTCLWRQ